MIRLNAAFRADLEWWHIFCRFLEWCVDDGERELVDTRGGNLE